MLGLGLSLLVGVSLGLLGGGDGAGTPGAADGPPAPTAGAGQSLRR